MKDSIKVRLPLLISLGIGLTLVVFLSISYAVLRRELLRAGELRAKGASDQIAGMLAQQVQQQAVELRKVADDPAVRRALAQPADAGAANAAKTRLQSLAAAGQPAIELWSAGGELRVSAAAPKGPRPVPTLPAATARTTDGVGRFHTAGSTLYWDTVASVTPDAEGGPALGRVVWRRVLTASGSGDAVRKLVGADAEIRVGNADGSVWTDLQKIVPAPSSPVQAGERIADRTPDGNVLLGFASRVRGAPWMTVLEFPRAAIIGPARTFTEGMLVAALLVAIVGGVGAYILSARITRPLNALTGAAEAIARGDFDQHIETNRRDEIGRLAAAFGAMASDLRASRTELERRVEERTRDVTVLNRELEARVGELKALTRELEAFSYTVSHDLRAPLRHITGFASLLQQRSADRLDAEGLRHVRTIIEAGARMGRLIDDLLAFSRMGRAEMVEARVDLERMVTDVIADVEHAAAGRAIEWTRHPLPMVEGDPAMLRQVITNLLSNAVKYTASRDVARIEIGTQPGGAGEQVIFVRDNGVGFDMQYAGKLFGVFQRLHSADTFEGTGIGLATVRRIVHRHGGRVWAEGSVDGGATFYVALPRRLAVAV